MNTVFIGGSRQISRLNAQVKERLTNIINSGHRVIVGDANGADKAVQKFFLDAAYPNVTVFCSGDNPRNNLGSWKTNNVRPPKHLKGFHFHAAKDREMAREADFGLMIWDGESAGTALNILRLVRAGKKAVLLNVAEGQAINFKALDDWKVFVSFCSFELVKELSERATPDEWPSPEQPDFLAEPTSSAAEAVAPALARYEEKWDVALNEALASGNPSSVLNALGNIAKARGMGQVAKEAGLARESLYRALNAAGNPEFVTVLKVIGSLGLQLSVTKRNPGVMRAAAPGDITPAVDS